MPAARCVLALDQGTTSSRALVFDRDGRILAFAQREFPQHFPQPGWVEHDPEDIWQSQMAAAIEALAEARISANEVAAVGIANQRETTLLWERTSGRPLHRAIVWQDRRTAKHCEALQQSGESVFFRQRTGLVLDPYFSGTKIAWLLDNIPGVRERASAGDLCFGTVDSWLAWRLTGGKVHATDTTNASRTLLCNLHNGEWDEDLLLRLDIPPSVLPQIVDSSQVLGPITAVPELSGIPLASLVGDQQAALAGQACFTPGLAKNTYGTGCFLLMHTGEKAPESKHGLLSTIAARRDGRLTYALEGAVFSAGSVVQWLRDGLGIINSASEIEALARSVPDTDDVFLVPAFTGLGAPHWDPHARGSLFGLTRGSTAAHLARAALESIAFQVADLVDAIEADAGCALAELRVDGGAAANDLLLQMQADLVQRTVVRPAVIETTALGAAYFAGLAVGFWSSLEEIAAHWQVSRRFQPTLSATQAAARRQRWQEAVSRSKNWA